MRYRRDANGINVFFNEITPNILRCTFTEKESAPNNSDMVKQYATELTAQPGSFQIHQEAGMLRVCGKDGNALLEIAGYEMKPIDVIRYTTKGEKPQVETIKTVDGERTVIRNLHPYKAGEAFQATLYLSLGADEGIYGLGQDEEGSYNHRGKKIPLYQHNMRIPMPCLYSSKGYGILFDCTSLMVFDDTAQPTSMLFDTVSHLDFYLVEGGAAEFVRAYRFLTGKAGLLPKWAFGYIQSRETYKTGEELVETARRYRELGIPIDCIVQDWKTWEGDAWGQKTVDKARYPDLKSVNEELHQLHVHSMVSVWPNMAEGCPNHQEFAADGLLLGDYSTYDAFSETARNTYWKQANEELFSGGFDAWWCDSTEPFTSPDWCGEKKLPDEERYALVGGEHKKYLPPKLANFYAVAHARGMYENQRNAAPHQRVLNLTRSGYAGIQQYGTVLWAGDTSASWETLRADVAKGLSMSMSGILYWTVDIGAFFVGGTSCWRKWSGNPEAPPVWFWNGDYDDGVANLGYRELYVRWLQFGCFLPMFRSHGTDTPREIWNFGKTGDFFYDAIEKTIRLRYRLLPYIYSAAAKAALCDGSLINSLQISYFRDQAVLDIADEFLLGDALLICPVLQPMYYDKHGNTINIEKTRTCYLPLGADWYDFWTGERHAGGQEIKATVDIDRIPVFVKAGSILPMQKHATHTGERQYEFDIHIYPGCDCQFTLYDDDGQSYDYEKGHCEKLEFSWCDSQQKLSIREYSRFREQAIRLHLLCGGHQQTVAIDHITEVEALFDIHQSAGSKESGLRG